MSDERKGQAPTPEEFFDTCIHLAYLTEKSLEAAAALRDETLGRHATFEKFANEAIKKIDEQAKELKEMYEPSAVDNATNKSQKAVAEFKNETESLLVKMRKGANAVTKGLVLRAMLGTAAAVAVTGGCMWILLRAVPSLDEIQARRSEIQLLGEDFKNFSGKNAQLKSVIENLVFTNGQYYARFDSTPVRICLDVNRPDTCGPYVPVR